MLAGGQVSAPTAWQNPQAGPMYPMNNYAAGPTQVPAGQVPAWDPAVQAGGPVYASAPGTFPGQTYSAPPVPTYVTAAMPVGSSPLSQSSTISPGVASMPMTQTGVQPNLRPGGAPPVGQPPYYGR